MMGLEISALGRSPEEFNGDLLIIGVFENQKHIEDPAEIINKGLDGAISNMIGAGDIKGKYGEFTLLYTFDKLACKRVLVVGLGKKEEIDYVKLQRISAKSAKEAERLGARKVASFIHGVDRNQITTRQAAQATAEGFILGLYKFDRFKTKKDESEGSRIDSLVLIGQKDLQEVGHGIHLGRIMAEAQNFARDLANTPANFLTPTDLADAAKNVAVNYGLQYKILDEKEMKTLGMNCLLGVGKGSAEPSKLIVLEYRGNPKSEQILTFVGKGVTFDTGGISLKPAQNMHEMKGDMGGAAAVLGAMQVIAQVKPRINVTMVIGAVENMPSSTAQKPGDVVYSMAGKTIEVLNTDAEGRLVLIDAITYAKKKLGATHIVDVATLTGAVLVALGTITTGVLTNNDAFLAQLKEASKITGEKIWELPNFPEYKDLLKSSVADLANIGGKNAGTITAGLFIGEFAENTPWIHLDIAGTATAGDNSDPISPKGETGSMVRTLAQLALSFK